MDERKDGTYYKFLMYDDEDYGEVYNCVDKKTGEDFILQIKKDGSKRFLRS